MAETEYHALWKRMQHKASSISYNNLSTVHKVWSDFWLYVLRDACWGNEKYLATSSLEYRLTEAG